MRPSGRLARHVVDGSTEIVDGGIFVVPADRLVDVTEDGVRLRPGRHGAPARSIDHLLSSAARVYRDRLIAVVLAGTGADGAAGAREVSRAGGTVVVERPEHAAPAMPESLPPTIVDAEAPLGAIGRIVVDLIKVAGPAPQERLDPIAEELRIANEDLATRSEELRLQAVAIVEQKQATEEEHDRLSSILASIGDAVVAVDHEGRTIATNVVYDRLFGGPDTELTLEDVAGMPFLPDDRPQRRAARGERFRVEFAVSDPDGTRRWFEAVAEPLTARDRTWGGVLSIRDVSERTMRLSLERLMAAAGHELKTPTAAIHNYLQLVERRLASGETADADLYARRAIVQAQRLDELVDRLFDVSRIRSGRLEIVTEPIDLAAVVREAVEVSSVVANAPPIEFTSRPATLRVLGDAGRLEQVFLNLVANAIEHAGGKGPIEVSVRRSDGFAVVDVRDHGHGIAADELSMLFEAYTRLGPAKGSTGLGLGLFVAREIVAAHGGTITVTSQIGSGSTFTVRLPATAPAPRPT